MTGGANFTRLIYPDASSGCSHLPRVTVGLKLDRLRLVWRIYDAAPVFVCSVCVEVRQGNLGKYIFLITVGEVNAAYLRVLTAAGGDGSVM